MSEEYSDGPLAARFAMYAETGMRRAQFEVGGEQVTLLPRGHRLRALCTCAAENCEHLDVVLRFLGETSALMPGERIRSSLRPPAPALADLTPLATAVDDLCLAVARSDDLGQPVENVVVEIEGGRHGRQRTANLGAFATN